jgi:hypothetical protein
MSESKSEKSYYLFPINPTLEITGGFIAVPEESDIIETIIEYKIEAERIGKRCTIEIEYESYFVNENDMERLGIRYEDRVAKINIEELDEYVDWEYPKLHVYEHGFYFSISSDHSQVKIESEIFRREFNNVNDLFELPLPRRKTFRIMRNFGNLN